MRSSSPRCARALIACILACLASGCFTTGERYALTHAEAHGDDVEFVVRRFRKKIYLMPVPDSYVVDPRCWHVVAELPTSGKLRAISVTEENDVPTSRYSGQDAPATRPIRPAVGPASTRPNLPSYFRPAARQTAGDVGLTLYHESPWMPSRAGEQLIVVDAASGREIDRFVRPFDLELSSWNAGDGRLFFSAGGFSDVDPLRLAVWEPLKRWSVVFTPSSSDVASWIKASKRTPPAAP